MKLCTQKDRENLSTKTLLKHNNHNKNTIFYAKHINIVQHDITRTRKKNMLIDAWVNSKSEM